MKIYLRLRGVLVIAMMLVVSFCAWGQVTSADISGTVLDSSGAAVPGVTVSITNEQTMLQRKTTTDSQGFYLATNLPPGSYAVKMTGTGFKVNERKGIRLSAGDRVNVSPVLAVGSLSEVVTVNAQGQEVETDSGTVGRLVDGSQVRDLALNGRNGLQLLMLQPGVVFTIDQFDRGDFAFGGVANVYVNGMRSESNYYTADGAYNMDSGSSRNVNNNVGVDFVSEVKMASSGYSAEYGRSGAGQINYVTRAGTDRYHGTLFEFFRNDQLNARNYFAPTIDKLRLNNFGWNLGGPIPVGKIMPSAEKKLFFFAGQEFKRRVDGQTMRATLPTTAQRAGIITSNAVYKYPNNFPVVSLRGQQIKDPSRSTSSNPNGLNILPQQYMSANGIAIMKIYDAMQSAASRYVDQSNANNAVFQLANYDARREDILRLDYQPTAKNQFTLRVLHDAGSYQQPYSAGALPTGSNNRINRATNVQATWTFVKSDLTVNELAVVSSYLRLDNRTFGRYGLPQTYGLSVQGLYDNDQSGQGIPSLSIVGYSGIPGAQVLGHVTTEDFSVRDNFTHLMGKHSLKIGGIFTRDLKHKNTAGNLFGSASFDPSGGLYTTGNALFDALLGNYRQYSVTNTDLRIPFGYYQWESYVADTWKMRPNLTIDLGVRYYYLPPATGEGKPLSTFLPSAFNPTNAQQVIAKGAGAGQLVPGVGLPNNGVALAGTQGLTDGFYQAQNKLSPRFGFAWDPWRKGIFAVRGGGAIYYDRMPIGSVGSAAGNPPFVGTVTLYDGSIDQLSQGRRASFPVAVSGFRRTVVAPATYNWNIGVQTKLAWKSILDLNYVSTQGRHLLRDPNINQVTPAVQYANSSLNFNSLRPYQGYTNITLYESSASSNYNALQASLTRRYTSSLTYSIAYTWSKVLTDATDASSSPENLLNYRAERSHASFDRNHVFVASYIYSLPFFRSQKGVLGKTAGGWQLSGMTQIQSGGWVTPMINTPTGSRRPDRVGDVTYFDPRVVQTLAGGNGQTVTSNFYFDPTPGHTFIAPSPTNYGNSKPYSVRGPGRISWDMSLFKNVALTDQVNLQFRAEAFNIFNHTNFENPNMSASDINYGTVSSAGPPRLLQLGLKLLF